jgi:hypothetical protein
MKAKFCTLSANNPIMKKLILSLSLFVSVAAQAQSNVYIHFIPKVGGVTVNVSDLSSTVYHDLNGIAFQIQAMSYYVSKIQLTHDGGQVINLDTPEDVLCVKINDNVFNLGSHNITDLEQIDFGVGVPQEWNHLDIAAYPVGHPLSFQDNPSMHWGWTAGYIHMALNALGDNNADDICDQAFQTHCLGDANYKNASVQLDAIPEGNDLHIYINCNIDEWIFGTDPGTTGVQHTETGVAVTVMKNVEIRDVFTPGAYLGLNEAQEIGNIFFHNTENALTVGWKEMNGMEEYQLLDMNGRVIAQGNSALPAGNVTVNDVQHGCYIFNCYSIDGKRLHSATVMH